MDDQQIRALHAQGRTVAEMAEATGASTRTIYRALARLELAPPERAGVIGEVLSEMMHIRLSAREIDEVKARAAERGLTPSEYGRAALLGRL